MFLKQVSKNGFLYKKCILSILMDTFQKKEFRKVDIVRENGYF